MKWGIDQASGGAEGGSSLKLSELGEQRGSISKYRDGKYNSRGKIKLSRGGRKNDKMSLTKLSKSP